MKSIIPKEEYLSNRAQAYWDTLAIGTKIRAEELFDAVRGKQDLNENIKYIRAFLSSKFNYGRAFLIPYISPATYIKLSDDSTYISCMEYCEKLLEALPHDDKFTIETFSNRLPLIYDQEKDIALGGFFNQKKKDNLIEYLTKVDGSPLTLGNHQMMMKTKSLKPVEVSYPSKEELAKTMANMTPSQAGMAIFMTLKELMAENENMADRIKTLKQKVHDTLESNSILYDNAMGYKREIKKLQHQLAEARKEPTFGELYTEKIRRSQS
jgi:hypothetical protein